MKQWFLGLAPRERWLVASAGGVAALALLYVLAVEPIVHGFAERERRIAILEQDLAWMVEAAGEVEALRSAGRDSVDLDDDRPAYLAVDSAVREADLPTPRRLEPDGENGAQVEFEEVDFDRLMRVLAQLEANSGVVVVRATFDRVGAGRVRADLTLERSR